MIVLLLLLLASPASAKTNPSDAWLVTVATTPAQAAGNISALTARLLAAQKANNPAAYSAARLALLENIAELQDWAERASDPASAPAALTYTLTAAGRAALGRRKPVTADFASRKGATRTVAGPLDFKP